MPPLRFLAQRRAAREAVQQDAGHLLSWMGGRAYQEARKRTRVCRERADRRGVRHWSRVAVEIAARTGHAIGKSTRERYLDEPLPLRSKAEREIADALVVIARGIADLARGRIHATSLHNIGAHVRRVIDLAGSRPALVAAGDDVIAACEALALAADESAAALASGAYPERAEAAGQALQCFRAFAAEGADRIARLARFTSRPSDSSPLWKGDNPLGRRLADRRAPAPSSNDSLSRVAPRRRSARSR